MIKKLFKRGLSLLLALVLVATTFFIFDPSLLKLDADAYVDTAPANVGKFLAAQNVSATETIYLKPGSSDFQYYENYNYQTGEVGNAVETSGSIYFSNSDASAVYLVVNNVYEKGSSTTFSGQLTINGKAINTYANLANGSDTYTQGDIFAQTTGGTLDYKINSGSLAGYTEGKVYIIEWLIGYEIEGALHLTFAYTGVYAPVLGQAGVTYNTGREYMGSTLYQYGYSFLTGAMKYGGGTGKSNFTNPNVINVAGGIGSNTTFTAPLVSFVGYANNSSNFTVPGNREVPDSYKSTTLFAQGTANIGGGVLVSQQRYNKSTSYLRTTWDDVGSYENPAPKGSTTNGSESWSYTTGVGYILVDKSRYTTYDQIPNLSLGWAQFEHHYHASGDNGLHKLYALDVNHNEVSSVNAVGFTSGDWDSADEEGRSYTRGLFHVGGTIREGLTEFEFFATNRFSYGVGTASGDFYTTVGLHTTTYNQAQLRRSYNNALCSNIDYYNIAKYASSSDYSAFYTRVKATAENLVDPTAKNEAIDQALETTVENIQKQLEEGTATKVYFYVPEVIYLTPSTAGTTTAVNFKWFADRANEDGGAVTSDVASKTAGNVYFHCAQAKSYSINVSKPTGSTVTLSNYTLGSTASGNKISSTMSGSAYNTTGQKITWTATWTNASGQSFTVERTSTIYKPNYVASGGAGRTTHGYGFFQTHYIQGAVYVTGFANSYTSGGYKVKDSYNLSLNPDWRYSGGSHWPATNLLDSQSNGPMAYTDGDDENVSHTLSGLNLFLDRSRYENYNQIPNLIWTITITDYKNTNSQKEGYFGYDATSGNIWSSGTEEGTYTGTVNAATPAASTTPSSHYFQGYFKGYRGGTGSTTVKINFNCYSYDKSGLREAYDYAMLKSNFLQKEYFTDSAWSAYTTALNNVINALQGVENTAVTSYSSYATTLKNQINKMIGAVTASGDTFSYTNASGTEVTGQNRADVIAKGTATVHHVMIDFDENGNLNTSTSGTTIGTTETKTYYRGETVYTGYNNYEGYNYFGYYRNEGTTKWTASLGTSVIKGDVVAQGTYGLSGRNTDEFVESANLTYTYIYSKDPAGVYMDWGASEQSFVNKQNLADLTDVEIDTAFTEDATNYGGTNIRTSTADNKTYESGVAIVDKTSTNSFSFTIKNPGYNTYSPRGKAVTNLFPNFDNYGWSVSSDRATITVDNANDSFTIVGNSTNTDIHTAWGGASRGVRGTGGHTYKLVFDVENNSTTAPAKVGSMWFTYATSDTSYSNWGGQVDNVRAGNGVSLSVAPGSSDTYETEFTVPAGYPNFSVRIQLNTADGNVTYSNVNIYDTSDSSQFAKMADLFFPNIATGLTGGKTYTVAFKSSLRYDDYHWYALDMYNQPNPIMDWAHEQGTVQLFISTTDSNGDRLYNYTVPVRVTTDVSSGGTIGTFELPAGCSNINLGFCITNDTAIGGWVSDIRIVEGDYVEVGAAGETYTMPDPLREGHSFTNWSEASTPFYGNISGTKNSTYKYGIGDDTVVANWQINKYDVVFDNEFRFDEYVWTGSNYSTATIDKENNTVRMVAKEAAGNPDAYIGAYNSSQTGYMTLIPGHTYKVSYDWVNNNTSVASSVGFAPYVFYGNTDPFSYTGSNLKSFGYTATGASGTHTFEFTVPEGLPNVAFRYGITTSKADITFSDLYFQDISRGTTTVVKDTTVSEPKYNGNNIHGVVRDYQQLLVINVDGSDLKTLPTMTSNGYFFKGWYTEKTGGTQVTDTIGYLTKAGTNQLWSQWQVHIEYDLSQQGGAYLDPTKAPQTSAKYDVGTALDDVKIADYVPYKVGYNFAGWKDKFQGNTYQPGDTISVLNYSLILEPVWVAATDVTKDTVDYEEITALHPGQVYYYAYTPANNDELVSGYVYGSSPDLTVALYNSTSIIANGQETVTYGVENLNSLVTGALTKGTEYYFGITAGNTAKVAVNGEKFKISEHKINYTLDPNGGSVSPETVVGHYNTATALVAPSRPGYSFTAWKNEQRSKSFTSSVDAAENSAIILGNTISFVSEYTLYAQWNINTYKLSAYSYYNTATGSTTVDSSYTLGEVLDYGGTVKVDDVSSRNGTASKDVVFATNATYSATAKTGYTFKGWYASPTITDGKITAWGDISTTDNLVTISMPANDVNMYARFDINTYAINLYAYSDSYENPGEYVMSTLGGTVYFDNGTGAATAVQTYVHGKTYTMNAVAAKGYKFDGWFYGDNPLSGTASHGDATKEITVTEAHSYKAKFSVQEYQLKINVNGGDEGITTSYKGYMGATVNVTQPTRGGYEFDGWTLVDDATNGQANGTIVNGIYTFGGGNDRATAKWKVVNYPITIDPAGGQATVTYYQGDISNTLTKTITEKTVIDMAYNSIASLPNPTKEGHEFAGWVASNSTGELVAGVSGAPTTYKVGLNDTATVITATWTVNNYPLYIDVWGDAANTEGSYNEGIGGTIEVGDVTGTKINTLVGYGTKATVTAVPATGYSFEGWTTTLPSTANNFNPISTSAVFETAEMGINGLHYYAVFGINEYTVTLGTAYNTANAYDTFVEGEVGGTVTGGGKYSHGQSATLEATAKTGYNFKGWFEGEEAVSVNPTYSVTVTDDINLVARFTISEYTITVTAIGNYANNPDRFDGNPNAGTFEGKNKYYHGQTTEITAVANPGYEFKGWFSDYALSQSVGDNTAVLKMPVTSSEIYYAKFEVIKINVNLYAMSNADLGNYEQNSVGGAVSYDNVTYAETASGECYFDGNYTVYAKPAPGYTFEGWFISDDFSGTNLGAGSYANGYYTYMGKADIAEGVNLYAKFSVGAYDLNVYAYSNTGSGLSNYDNNNVGGTVGIIKSDFVANEVEYDETLAHASADVYFDRAVEITATAKTGYSFSGWYTDRNNFAAASELFGDYDAETKVYTLDTSAMVVEGLNYYAKFDVGSFTIVYNPNGGADIPQPIATAYYNTDFVISSDSPVKVGYTFIGWSVEDSEANVADYVVGETINAGTVADWYANVYKGNDVTLYAVWVINANYIFATAAYSQANGEYKIGTTGGTVEVVSRVAGDIDDDGYVAVPAGAIVYDYLKTTPASGYAFRYWRWKTLQETFTPEQKISATWGNEGTGSTTMPSQTLYVVAFFEIRTFSAKAYAYYNTAAVTDEYSYGATGGTVKCGYDGKNASNAVSENANFGREVEFIATPARGYSFDGWYAEPVKTNDKVDKANWGSVLETKNNFKVVVEDDSQEGNETANNYYAVFSIKYFTATASVKTYSVREDMISSIPADQWPGGTPSNNGGNVGLGLTAKTDSTWKWSEKEALSPTINVVYYGEKVYFEAKPNKGYIFGGWYNAENAEYYGENLVEETELTYSRIMREGNIYMEAKFVPVSFTLVLDANGGVEGNPTEIIVTYGVSLMIDEASAPTKTGSIFMGWADAQGDTVAKYEASKTIGLDVVSGWYDNLKGDNRITIYAVWEEAKVTIIFDKQGATDGDDNTQITVGSKLPEMEELPEYEGFIFGGYYEGVGGTGVQYYNADGTPTAQLWNNPSGGTIYALWTCPVLESIEYDKATGEWIYTYRDENGGKTPVESKNAVISATELTAQVAGDSSLMWWTKNVDTTTTDFVEKQIEKTPEINLNHYSDSALTDLRTAVTETNTSEKLGKLTQPQANAYVARMAKDMELDFEANKKGESQVPTVKVYETSSKLETIKKETITNGEDSANGTVYSVPSSSDAASYAYAGKWSYTEQKAVDYYLYTNSPNPVIALEIGDGEVASTVASNTSSYPTKATVTDNAAGFGYVNSDYTMSAVKAADDLDKAWFTQYTKAGIGTAHDYNAKTVIYLTPEFTSSGTQNEIVYTIKASDDAYVPNEGVADADLSGGTLSLQWDYSSYVYDKASATGTKDITICICYHNSMNGDSDEGTLDASGDYMQMYMDQVGIDTYINQLHLFRTSGGASNWDFPTTGESVYPVEDKNYPYSETSYVLGSFMYVFDATNEADATAFAAAGNYAKAKETIIESVKGKAAIVSRALASRSDSNNLHSNAEKLGFVQITGWSNNFYPKTGSYVYVHLVDRWGNVFNRVWKCYNVDSYPSTILAGGGTAVYNIFEDGGSSIDTMNLDGANVEFILDDNSSYENGVFTTTGNSVSIATGEANKTYSLTVTDKATNTNTVEVTTDGDGVLVLNVEDACADLSAGAYSFTLNGETVNLYSGVEKLVYSAAITEISQVGMETVVTVKTSKDVVKLQLVEGIATRTYTREVADSVVENEDGTLTWTLKLKLSKGVHSYALKAKNLNGWETTEYTLTTEVIDEYVSTPVALKSVYNAKVEAGEKPVIEAKTLAGTQKLQLVYSSGATITYNRSDDIVISTVDGVETWALTSSAFSKAGEYEVKVRAKYNNEWQDASAKISTVTVTEKVVDTTPVILSVEAQSASAKIYDYVTFKVVTNSNATKIRFNYPSGDTWTFAENPEYTTVNADGTKTWTVAVKFYVLGENDITFSTRNADGWVDAQTFGTIEITK